MALTVNHIPVDNVVAQLMSSGESAALRTLVTIDSDDTERLI